MPYIQLLEANTNKQSISLLLFLSIFSLFLFISLSLCACVRVCVCQISSPLFLFYWVVFGMSGAEVQKPLGVFLCSPLTNHSYFVLSLELILVVGCFTREKFDLLLSKTTLLWRRKRQQLRKHHFCFNFHLPGKISVMVFMI